MQVSEALRQLEVIHDQLTKSEVYRGFRAPGVALAGVTGLAAMLLEPCAVAPGDAYGFVLFWASTAALAGLAAFGATTHAYLFREDEYARRRTRRAVGQFLPCLFVGALVTLVFVQGGPALIPYLPGLWAVLFSLGVFATRPYLPWAATLVGLFFLVAGVVLLARAAVRPELAGWMVGGVFGVGELATAVILYFSLEKSDHG